MLGFWIYAWEFFAIPLPIPNFSQNDAKQQINENSEQQ